MAKLWDTIKERLSVAGRAVEPGSVLTGRETDAELRELAYRFSQQCPIGELNRHCPFHTLNGLHHATTRDVLDKMNRASLMEMFEDERLCRKEHADKCFKPGAESNAESNAG
ncbi:MAG: hypothetical protein P4N60_05290 [Verrucomicrobiae bacterium]|nr:hypothetical protein [Verrucomicrobiae bacterium]